MLLIKSAAELQGCGVLLFYPFHLFKVWRCLRDSFARRLENTIRNRENKEDWNQNQQTVLVGKRQQ